MSNIMNSKYLDTSTEMSHYLIHKRTGLCITYEVYDELTNQFVMSCVSCPQMTPLIIFTTLQDCHLRSFEDICCNLNLKYFLGRMIPDWMTGYVYNLTGPNGQFLCEIRVKAQIMTSSPTAFAVKIANLEFDADGSGDQGYSSSNDTKGTVTSSSSSASLPYPSSSTHSIHKQEATLLENLFSSCFPDGSSLSCLDESDPNTFGNAKTGIAQSSTKTLSREMKKDQNYRNFDSKSRTTTSTTVSYTSLSESNTNLQFTYISTKKPIWNSEINQWMHFFGGRVKIPSVHNFLAVEVPPIHENSKVHYYQSAIQEQNMEKICIRHGKVANNSFILDFRAPISPLVAFGIMCAVHCH